jgi:hypothetical protein
VFRSAARPFTFPDNPLRIVPVVFRIRECVFRRPGLYWIQFWHNGRPVDERALLAE